jgi:hypothetical protein
MLLDDVIPKRITRSPKSNSDNLVLVEHLGPWRASITVFAGPFWEKNTSTTSTPYYSRCKADDPKAIPRIRVHCTFDELQGRSGEPLVLSCKYKASRDVTSAFANLVAGLAKLPVEQIAQTNLDLNDFIGRRVDVMLKPDRDGFARIASIAPLGSTVAATAGM